MEVCRSCMKSSNYVTHIFAPLKKIKDEDNELKCVANILNELAGCKLVTTNDEFPQFVCNSCIKTAEDALKFKRMLEKSHRRFSNKQIIMNAVKIELNPDEFDELRSICDMLDMEDLQPMEEAGEIEYSTPNKNTKTTRSSVKKENISYSLRTRNRVYSPKKVLTSVKAEKENSEDSLSCPFCDYQLSSKGNLKIHVRIHTGERPYKCPHCTKTFVQRSALTVHTRTHTGEQPFQCPKCPKAFKQVSNLLRHFAINPKHQKKKRSN